MVAAVKHSDYVEQLARGVHNWGTHTFKVAFSNAAPNATHAVLADIGQIATGGGYTGGAGGGLTLDTVALSETAGTAQVSIADEVFVASGGATNSFRTNTLYNDSTTSPADALVMSWDYGSSIALLEGESWTLDFGANVWTLA